MPMPDDRRERGAKTQTTQQTVQVQDTRATDISPIATGAAAAPAQLQINPNQARVVQTGGELAQAFAGVAAGVQKGIQAYQQMEKTVEEARWADYETEYIRQSSSVNGDPAKMKEWIDANPFDAGRHTKKRFWDLHAKTYQRDYVQDQEEYYNDTLRVAATKLGADRQQYLQQRLDALDENSPVYGKISSALSTQVAKNSDQLHRNQMIMQGSEMNNQVENGVAAVLATGADYNLVVNSGYGQNLMRAMNFGVIRVTPDGKYGYHPVGSDPSDPPQRVFTINEAMDPAFDAHIMEQVGLASQSMSPDMAALAFSSIKINKERFATSRRANSAGIDRATNAEDFFNAATDVSGSSSNDELNGVLLGLLDDHIGSLPENVSMSDGLVGRGSPLAAAIERVGKDPTIPFESRRAALDRLETILTDEEAYGAALAKITGDREPLSDSVRDRLVEEIRNARKRVTTENLDQLVPFIEDQNGAARSAVQARGQEAMLSQGLELLAGVRGDTGVAVNTKDGSFIIPSGEYANWSALNKDHYVLGAVIEGFPGTSNTDPQSLMRGSTQHMRDVPTEITPYVSPNPKQVETLSYYRALDRMEDPNYAFPAEERDLRTYSIRRLAKESPEAAVLHLANSKQGAVYLADITGDTEATAKVRGQIISQTQPSSYESYQKWNEGTRNLRRVLRNGQSSADTLFGYARTPGQNNGQRPIDRADEVRNMEYMAAIYGDVLFDDLTENWASEETQQTIQNRLRAVGNYVHGGLRDQTSAVRSLADQYLFSPDPEEEEALSQSKKVLLSSLRRGIVLQYNEDNGTNYASFDELIEAEGEDNHANPGYITGTYVDPLVEADMITRVMADDPTVGSVDSPQDVADEFTRIMPRILQLNAVNTNPNLYYDEQDRLPSQQAVGELMSGFEGRPDRIKSVGLVLFSDFGESEASNRLPGYRIGLDRIEDVDIRRELFGRVLQEFAGSEDGPAGRRRAAEIFHNTLAPNEPFSQMPPFRQQQIVNGLTEYLNSRFTFTRNNRADDTTPRLQTINGDPTRSNGGMYARRGFTFRITDGGIDEDSNLFTFLQELSGLDTSFYRVYGLNEYYNPNLDASPQ